MRNKMFFSMDNLYSKNLYLKSRSIQKINNSHKFDKLIPYSYNHFINLNGIIYFVPDRNMLIGNLQNDLPITTITYIKPKTDLLALSELTINTILSGFSKSRIPKDIARKFASSIKSSKSVYKIMDYPKSNCIIDSCGNCVTFLNDIFDLQYLKDSDVFNAKADHNNIVNGYIYNCINGGFIYGQYHIPEKAKELLRKITGNNPSALMAIAKLVAASYSNGLPLKEAMVLVAKNDACKELESFLEKLFEGNIYYISDKALKNQKSFFGAYTDTLFMSGGAYILKDVQAFNIKLLRNIIKSVSLEIYDKYMGKIKFRNKIPLIVLAQDKDYARSFKGFVKSYIINCDDDFCMADCLTADEFTHLRQALALYGLKLLSSPKKAADSSVGDAQSDEDIAKEFVHLYCKKHKYGIIGKSDIKEAFKDYALLHYPHFKGSPLSVCNYLQDSGYDTKHKKRLNGSENPVGVIMGIEFDSEQFEKDIEATKKSGNYEKTELEKDAFYDIWEELLSSTIELTKDNI
ncbi:MAG: hypothetical protein E7389_05565 [Ruminococcaceae bacterium]|nr:hypothetical protein [Oscillospiraceae bacterium]